ncbi:Tyrosine-protein kinase JAK2 [Actinacidiphila cocklensis]|uniref:Tyrosine-protein kinase JAK2 n=1 Tax=Actinacidiphila cocklensis TaxID=887465 RepID=A0A9W4GPG9_9ACTN|nr:Tyrosine-protein kinase JAK2 [Actinacidiphila cocklensis]
MRGGDGESGHPGRGRLRRIPRPHRLRPPDRRPLTRPRRRGGAAPLAVTPGHFLPKFDTVDRAGPRVERAA